MRYLITLAGGTLLLIGTGVAAQQPTVPAQPPSPADTATEAPADTATGSADGAAGAEGFDVGQPAAGAATSASFTDDQISAFVAAASAIRDLPDADGPEKQQQARDIVAAHGITTETYNAIGTAMRTDEALAARVQIALQTRPASPEG
jgi:hypothetical protein